MTKEEANKHFLEEELGIKGDNAGHDQALEFINEQGEPAEGGNWMGDVKGMAKYAMQFPHEFEQSEGGDIEEPGTGEEPVVTDPDEKDPGSEDEDLDNI